MHRKTNAGIGYLGTMSKTITLPVEYWAEIAEICRHDGIPMRIAIIRIVKAYKQRQKMEGGS